MRNAQLVDCCRKTGKKYSSKVLNNRIRREEQLPIICCHVMKGSKLLSIQKGN